MYSKKIIKKKLETSNGDEIFYSTPKIGAKQVNREGFKILKAFIPSFGAGMDSFMSRDIDIFEPSYTLAASLQLLSENLTEDHYDDLTLKLMGELSVDGVKLENLDDHFDEYPEHFFEVLFWLFKENFWTFFMANATAQSMINRLTGVAKPMLSEIKERMTNDLTSSETDSETES